MQSIFEKNTVYHGAENKASVYDISVPENWNGKLIIFIHGYMGYKDWGAWSLMESFFVDQHFGFVKYNVSHNGGTVDNPIDFPDLDAFSRNNYLKEVQDFEALLETVKVRVPDSTPIYLIGHSRGGGIALLQSQNKNVSKIATLAAISSIATRFPQGEELEKWKEHGVWYRTNGRTKQEMPHIYEQYTNFIEHQDRLSIEHYVKNAHAQLLIIHGEEDLSVKISEGEQLAQWTTDQLIRIAGEQHTFGASQPWEEKHLPLGLKTVCEHLIAFFNEA